ncbi:protein shisa-1-like isoform 1-T1 [Urocitellus parryii]|uniref:Shisa N-terminal domain-containing protein n=1 Tax=Urocitellus parryii TaxID=9999 RepID=A0A8D2ITA6_UROPR
MGRPQWSGMGLLLGASVLLLAMLRSAKSQGEFCHHWMDSTGLLHGGFLCPEGYDKPTATFCCGTCSLRYCCATLTARLDQGQCPEDITWDPKEAILPPPEGSIYLPLVIVSGTFVTFILLGILAGVACFRCLRSQRRDELCTAPQNPEVTVLSSTPTHRRNVSGSPLLCPKPDAGPALPFTTQEYPESTIRTIPKAVTRPFHWPLLESSQIPSLTTSTAIVLSPSPLLSGTISYGPASGPHPTGTT